MQPPSVHHFYIHQAAVELASEFSKDQADFHRFIDRVHDVFTLALEMIDSHQVVPPGGNRSTASV